MLMQEPTVPMAFLRAIPIGIMPMLDQGEQDDKVWSTSCAHCNNIQSI